MLFRSILAQCCCSTTQDKQWRMVDYSTYVIDRGYRGPLVNCEVDSCSGSGVLVKHSFADGSAFMRRVMQGHSEEVIAPDEAVVLGEGEYITIGAEFANVGTSKRVRCFNLGARFDLYSAGFDLLRNVVSFTDNAWAVSDQVRLLLVDRKTGKGEVIDTPIESWRLIFEVSDELVVCWEAMKEQYNDMSVIYRQGVFERGDVLWVASRKRPTVWCPVSIDDITLTSGVESSFMGSYVLSVSGNQLLLAPAIGEEELRSARPVPDSSHIVTFDRDDPSKYSKCEQDGLMLRIGTRGHRVTASTQIHVGDKVASSTMVISFDDIRRRIEGAKRWVYQEDLDEWKQTDSLVAVSDHGYIIRRLRDGRYFTEYLGWDGSRLDCQTDGVWRSCGGLLWCVGWRGPESVIKIKVSVSSLRGEWYIASDY